MSARDAIFGKIRRSLGVTGEETRRNATVDDRLARTPKGVIPARGQIGPEERVALFATMAEKTGATVTHVGEPLAIPAAVADYLRDRNLPATIRIGHDPLLNGLGWGRTQIEIKHGASDGHDPVGLSHAFAGVAETGTLVLTSGGENPTTLNFLPDTHIVVVKASAVIGDYETVWANIRGRYGKSTMPRTVNFVTGPSRSGDIEQTILLGAHGPRRLHIVIVDG
jgi:L-lactate dehydrogenase complex protein LldG